MNLLTTESETSGKIEPHCRDIDEFVPILERDKASQVLAYIFHISSPESPFAEYEQGLRSEKVIDSIFGGDWEPDDEVEDAIEKYKEINETREVKLLKSARLAIDKLRIYFDDIDLTERDEKGKPVYKAKDLIKELGELGDVVEGLKKLEEQVAKEQAANQENRGGVQTNEFSQ